MEPWDIRDKHVLITGGNTGIGLATAISLARKGAHVAITSRSRSRGEAAVKEASAAGAELELRDLDLGSIASIETFASAYLRDHDRLHVLINNAGAVLGRRELTADGFEATFGVNHLGHFLLTQLLLDRIIESAPARIINLSSSAHAVARSGMTWDDLQRERRYSEFQVYAESKLANIYFTRALASRLEGTNVTVNAVHPGVVATHFGADGDASRLFGFGIRLIRGFMRTPDQGAATTIKVACDPALAGTSGLYFANSRIAKETRIARDPKEAERLWSVSESMLAAARAKKSA